MIAIIIVAKKDICWSATVVGVQTCLIHKIPLRSFQISHIAYMYLQDNINRGNAITCCAVTVQSMNSYIIHAVTGCCREYQPETIKLLTASMHSTETILRCERE